MTVNRDQHRTRMLDSIRMSLNRWDPIQILDTVPDPPLDEYDILILPIARLLVQPDAAHAIIIWLRNELFQHFGLEPDRAGVEVFVEHLVDCYRSGTGDFA